ncbi:MAG: KUP/HAK/KT family potassium transporter [Saprospiraceae bacterium]|nr:KUP/HAK/KT family potassium transporter [Saprospiraceae bacterium]
MHFLTLTLQATFKYILLTLQADNHGEGGIFHCMPSSNAGRHAGSFTWLCSAVPFACRRHYYACYFSYRIGRGLLSCRLIFLLYLSLSAF